MKVNNFSVGFTPSERVTNGMHKVGLPQAHSAIQKQRVIGVTRAFRYLLSSSHRKLVTFAFNKIRKCVAINQVVLMGWHHNRWRLLFR